ncbi:MipA/OmpV family protein [Trinickia terrae]|uniref:MipA/OmpV family protein n=1 Tax=Trinickia terrae TaxID=2571161 RepID=A0A4U1HX46_9BURK|nr:MipA/OmpV family protein [Trinickia terrae]TKC86289.1 MipA/OmpV family protein [Trinickia terrae]
MNMRTVSAFAVAAVSPLAAFAQTPSPFAEWQYSAGIPLERIYEPELPVWRIRIGPGTAFQPLYDGSSRYHVLIGPSFDIRYRNLLFLSSGDGAGVDFLSGQNWRLSFAVAYDLGRREADDREHLQGLGNINPAPALKLFGDYVISKQFPLDIRADIRRNLGGADGWIGDIGAYLPMPGSSENFFWFAGPSVTFADSAYMNSWFGVNATQAARSGYPQYRASAGVKSYGLGVSASWLPARHWIMNADTAIQQLVGSAAHSPITQRATGVVLSISVDYEF